eukprot:TRINITY_DN28269_c0_g1_i1.p1 TRINITY_DN28269_c0_g1~~TRINITY_DN28269_c0_g1_i1.p1  ORF type:complete len:295 (+),score=71.64 TRINITY_DN28269_c0_g1_i1:896-1780(+)
MVEDDRLASVLRGVTPTLRAAGWLDSKLEEIRERSGEASGLVTWHHFSSALLLTKRELGNSQLVQVMEDCTKLAQTRYGLGIEKHMRAMAIWRVLTRHTPGSAWIAAQHLIAILKESRTEIIELFSHLIAKSNQPRVMGPSWVHFLRCFAHQHGDAVLGMLIHSLRNIVVGLFASKVSLSMAETAQLERMHPLMAAYPDVATAVCARLSPLTALLLGWRTPISLEPWRRLVWNVKFWHGEHDLEAVLDTMECNLVKFDTCSTGNPNELSSRLEAEVHKHGVTSPEVVMALEQQV